MREIDLMIEKLPEPVNLLDYSNTNLPGLANIYHHETRAGYNMDIAVHMRHVPKWIIPELYKGTVAWKDAEGDKCHLIWRMNTMQLIRVARKLLCFSRHPYVRHLMVTIKLELLSVDPALSVRLVPNCIYRGGYCYEAKIKTCGFKPQAEINKVKEESDEFIKRYNAEL